MISQHEPIWAAFKSVPSALMTPNEVSAIIDPDSVVTFTGELSFYFDLENTASTYEIIINSIDLAVQQEQPDAVTNLMFLPPGSGGGGYTRYGVSLYSSSPISESGNTKIQPSKLVSGDGKQIFDTLSLLPTEREFIRVDLLLSGPGKYSITPIINYSFREKPASVYASTFKIIYPRSYEGWSNDQGQGTMRSSNMIVDLQTGRINYVPASLILQKDCLPTKGQIAFSSSMLTFGSLGNVFIYDFSDNNIYQLSPFSFTSDENVTLQDGRELVGVWGYDMQLNRNIPSTVYEYDLTAFKGRIIASGDAAAKYENVLKPSPNENVKSSIFNGIWKFEIGLWKIEITGQNEGKDTDLVMTRIDGCRTTLISMPQAHLKSLFP